MPFGYTPLDPLIVLLGTGLAVYFLGTRPLRLMAWLPAMLTVYFFIPFVTLLTMWQTVPLLLASRVLLKGQIRADGPVRLFLLLLLTGFAVSAFYAGLLGHDLTRAVIRSIFYIGVFAIMSFTYEMGRREDCYELLLKGLAILGTVLAVYALYQLLAAYTGLPFRGILRGIGGAQAAFEGGFFRPNSLASEPKRLGYVMFVCALACLFLARLRPEQSRRLNWTGAGILVMSLFTFAGSYFAAIALFGILASILFPSRSTKYVLGFVAVVVITMTAFQDSNLVQTIEHGIERRLNEVEVGLDGYKVYRQEFYAWDYLDKNPSAALFGVGVGQYYQTFSNTYGLGAGISEKGGLLPLNSNFLELVFDLGGIVATAFYGAIVLLILALRRQGETFLCLALLFLTVQSLSILTLHFMVLFAGVGTGRLALARQRNRRQAWQMPAPEGQVS